ncbi:MAG: putative DNA binding domain-containing protein [Nitrospirae bacterium]|nr:putative DNA binding domain-containing protein [Nitrospirota bacterium]
MFDPGSSSITNLSNSAPICGFANAAGGILVIGKNNKGDVTGVEQAEKQPSIPYNPLRSLCIFPGWLY